MHVYNCSSIQYGIIKSAAWLEKLLTIFVAKSSYHEVQYSDTREPPRFFTV